MTALIGIDWGTTSFRAWRMGAGGEVLDRVGDGPGILAAAGLPGGSARPCRTGSAVGWERLRSSPRG
ncbi:2-dehydro-3-deoxygalactonokinase [Paracoccus aerius]